MDANLPLYAPALVGEPPPGWEPKEPETEERGFCILNWGEEDEE